MRSPDRKRWIRRYLAHQRLCQQASLQLNAASIGSAIAKNGVYNLLIKTGFESGEKRPSPPFCEPITAQAFYEIFCLQHSIVEDRENHGINEQWAKLLH